MERERFLARVRSALRGTELPDVVGPETAPVITFADPVGRFIDEARAVDAEVVRVADPGEAMAAVIRLVEESGDTRGVGPASLVAWEDLEETIPGFFAQAATRGWESVDTAVGFESRYADHARIERVAVGITGADAGIAATGSVLLAHGAGRARSVSLLVDHHVVLLPVGRIVSSLGQALSGVDWDSTSNVVAITGPSRTGDIESILTLGVHGPRRLSVVLVDDPSATG